MELIDGNVIIPLDEFKIIYGAAKSHVEDLSSGIDDGVYEDTEENQTNLEALEKVLNEIEFEIPVQLFLNHYECYNCHHTWTDIYPAQPDDDCPKCEARHCSPIKSEDYHE